MLERESLPELNSKERQIGRKQKGGKEYIVGDLSAAGADGLVESG